MNIKNSAYVPKPGKSRLLTFKCLAEAYLPMQKSASSKSSLGGISISARLWKSGKKDRIDVQTPWQFLSHMIQQVAHNADVNITFIAKPRGRKSQEETGFACGEALGTLFRKICTPTDSAAGLDEAQAYIAFEAGCGLILEIGDEKRFINGKVEGMEQRAVARFLEGMTTGLGKRMVVIANGHDTHHLWEAVHRAIGRSLAGPPGKLIAPPNKINKKLLLNSAESIRDTGEVAITASVKLGGKGVRENIGEPAISEILKAFSNGLGAAITVDYRIKKGCGYNLQHVKNEETFKTLGKCLFAMLKQRMAATGVACAGFSKTNSCLITTVYDGRPLLVHAIDQALCYGELKVGEGAIDLAAMDDGLQGLVQAMGISLVITQAGTRNPDILPAWSEVYEGAGKAIANMLCLRPYLKGSVAGVQKVEG
ncbi:hypothetical protein COT30_02200 [Candidatus Micrarchaeota archaeon CG08_land_8_20_14_0_20_49_17]|nr:MAG: hypothetical protein AUJ13_01025 [Candidatus Micrarchaeota archaeon CG1_02_49_24]PIU09869.1 MAG: hypothetical protein COT30_02200 [Candidatus Micrarchaeota archaeon CG08_land_8_20_14_0_20_49_17]PIU81194.1 MAG: hypothetical protein COS70_05335 [Candidatus Micrarchaeota archaeon CG06_land_8_20_14_3_00_50_6]PIZ99215.1 MAG: hypothetical protein COX84_01260 [Candidatus Micrarchaeota archaeon CG_4_10_14_0_2_um_filter_49_7]